jgi:hypothetical protein
VARPVGFEPTTSSLEGSCSIQLSYGRVAILLAALIGALKALRVHIAFNAADRCFGVTYGGRTCA